MKNSCRYFENHDCEYYSSCHGGRDKNCLFCFCPLYYLECIGKPVFLKNGIKDCSECTLPHTEKGYDIIIEFIKKHNKKY